ncbi:MAG: hypothetical protein ACJ8IQ_04580 [Chthoniobacterales bacterium]|jgi:hypothetical protein
MDFDKIIKSAEQGIIHLAETTFTTYRSQAISDGKAFLTAAENDLKKYSRQLAAGEITADEFKDLMQDEGDLAKMEALKEAGLAHAAFDSFINGVIGIMITAVFSAIP